MDPHERLIVALDLPTVEAARGLVERLEGTALVYKIGYRLAYAPGGLAFAAELARAGVTTFLDFKLHDIDNTVAEGTASAVALGAGLLTVHAYPQTMRAAVRGRGRAATRLLAVTVLTSYGPEDLAEAGYGTTDVARLVQRRARQAREAGIDGVVCAAGEAALVREAMGPDALIVTPGIRPMGAAAGDQKRAATPGEAIRQGATHLVVGRPITAAADPKGAAEAIIEEIAGVL